MNKKGEGKQKGLEKFVPVIQMSRIFMVVFVTNQPGYPKLSKVLRLPHLSEFLR